MPSPYGNNRNAAQYYEYGGLPMNYMYNWDGMPMGARPPRYSRSLGASEDFLDVQAHLHTSLGATYPVAMSMESATRSVRHSGMEQTRIIDGALGIFDGLSNNEKTLALLVAGAAAVFVGVKLLKRRR